MWLRWRRTKTRRCAEVVAKVGERSIPLVGTKVRAARAGEVVNGLLTLAPQEMLDRLKRPPP
jgi:hypothetical protein